jgi:hypothetical protein
VRNGSHRPTPGHAERRRPWFERGQILAGSLGKAFMTIGNVNTVGQDHGIGEAELVYQIRFQIRAPVAARHDFDPHDAQIARLLQQAADLPAVEAGARCNIGVRQVLLISHPRDLNHQLVASLIHREAIGGARLLDAHVVSPTAGSLCSSAADTSSAPRWVSSMSTRRARRIRGASGFALPSKRTRLAPFGTMACKIGHLRVSETTHVI